MAFYDEVKAQEDIPYRDNIIRSRVTEWPVGSGEFYLVSPFLKAFQEFLLG